MFALIGPKKADVPWKVLKQQGWIATAVCREVRVPLPDDARLPYAVAEPRDRFRLAAENPAKADVVREILAEHPGEPALVIGTYLDQLRDLARALDAPLLTGATAQPRGRRARGGTEEDDARD